jgi:uncharacterized protein
MTDVESCRFSGYASLFGRVDLGKDRVERGAFQKSLSVLGLDVPMLLRHNFSDVIGRWLTIREDEVGLFVEGVVHVTGSLSAEVVRMMSCGALDGLSIGFKTMRSERDEESGIRRLHEVSLEEISVVVFPLLPEARITEVTVNEQGQRIEDGQD